MNMRAAIGSAAAIGAFVLLGVAPGCGEEGTGASTDPGATSQSAAALARTLHSNAFSEAGRRSLRGGSDEPPRDGGTMVQCITTDFGTLNNITRETANEETVCRTYLFPPLLDLEPDTLELVPLVAAARPEISPDRRRYTFTLRPGILWQRRTPAEPPVEVTTEDVLFSWRMISDPAVVKAARARLALGVVESVEAIDRYRFVVVTSRPYFRTELEFGFNFRLMPAHRCTREPAAFDQDPLGRAPIGYGPYALEEWKAGQYLAFVRNPDWFAADRLPYRFERLRIHVKCEIDQVPALFERGELLIGALNDCGRYEEMKRDPAWHQIATFHEYYLPLWLYVAWNQLQPQFADARVRRALTMLFPRELVRDQAYHGHAFVISGPWAVTAKEYDLTVAPLPFDPVAAKALLDEAGWIDGDGDGVRDRDGRPFRFVLKYVKTRAPAFTLGTVWFQEQLRRAGIEMELRPMEFLQLKDELRDHRFDAAMLAWGADPRDDDVYDRFHSEAIAEGSNYGSYRSEECDRLLAEFRAEFDEARRESIAHAIHRRLAEDQPWTFLFNPRSLVIVSTKLRNVKLHTLGARWFDWWCAE